mgnify:CR=1 FL=1
MAKTDKKRSNILDVIRKDYPAERLLMGILGVIVIVFGVYIIQGVKEPTTGWLIITNRTSWWSAWIFGTDTKILIFSWFIIVVGVVSLGMAVWPFVKPSLVEMKKVSWPNGKMIQNHSARVYGFIFFLIGMFILYELALIPFFSWIRG